jgi:threonine dehydrogenase-like Zn-dependent dehydrogenase
MTSKATSSSVNASHVPSRRRVESVCSAKKVSPADALEARPQWRTSLCSSLNLIAAGSLFGYGSAGVQLHGAQAEYVRVPLAMGSLVPVPHDVSSEAALLAGDILSTAMFCCQNGDLPRLALEV